MIYKQYRYTYIQSRNQNQCRQTKFREYHQCRRRRFGWSLGRASLLDTTSIFERWVCIFVVCMSGLYRHESVRRLWPCCKSPSSSVLICKIICTSPKIAVMVLGLILDNFFAFRSARGRVSIWLRKSFTQKWCCFPVYSGPNSYIYYPHLHTYFSLVHLCLRIHGASTPRHFTHICIVDTHKPTHESMAHIYPHMAPWQDRAVVQSNRARESVDPERISPPSQAPARNVC